MGVVRNNDIRKAVKKYIDTANDKTVKMIHAMLQAEEKEDVRIGEAIDDMIDKRFSDYEKGKAKIISLEALEAGARESYKKSKRIAK